MRLFQCIGLGRAYRADFDSRFPAMREAAWARRLRGLLDDRYGATHILKPVYDGDPDAFLSFSDDPALLAAWAREHGLAARAPQEVLLAQIESHRAEVFYCCDPLTLPSSFVRRLPGCVKKKIAWRAAPVGVADLSAYDVVVSNFQSFRRLWAAHGWRTAWFSPSWDPETAPYAASAAPRDVDVSFSGSYSRIAGHDTRMAILDAVAGIPPPCRIDLRLQRRRWGRLADAAPWRWIPWPNRLPPRLRGLVRPPVYGRRWYELLARSRVTLNPAIDITGDERGNMRCWEALGCGTCMVASAGRYPEGFEPGVHFETFTDAPDALRVVRRLLADEARRAAMARAGAEMVARVWSKDRQWSDFLRLVDSI